MIDEFALVPTDEEALVQSTNALSRHASFISQLSPKKRKQLMALEKSIRAECASFRKAFAVIANSYDAASVSVWKTRLLLSHGLVEEYWRGPFFEATGIHERTARRMAKRGKELQKKAEDRGLNLTQLSDLEIFHFCNLLGREGKETKRIDDAARSSVQQKASKREFAIPSPVSDAAIKMFGSPNRVISACQLDSKIVSESPFVPQTAAELQFSTAQGTLLINAQEPLALSNSLRALVDRVESGIVSPSLIVTSSGNSLVWDPLLRRFPRLAFRGTFTVVNSKGDTKTLPHAIIGIALISAERCCELAEGFESVADVFSPVIS